MVNMPRLRLDDHEVSCQESEEEVHARLASTKVKHDISMDLEQVFMRGRRQKRNER